MSINTNIKIETIWGRRLDYESPEDLNIKLNRIIDDYTKPDTRFGEFSYSFKLPKTKNNAKIFGFADTNNVKRKFSINPIDIRVFNNDALVLQGLLEVENITRDNYECRFYSKLTQLVDSFEDVNLLELNAKIIDDWQEETSIREHINADYKDSDETDYQFPLVFYNTYFTPFLTYNGLQDFDNYGFPEAGDRPQQNFYYILNRTQTGEDNEFYHHQFPLCFYLKYLMKLALESAGWSLSGSFWETPEAKQIIMLYTGENDVYDSARLWKNISTGEYKIPTSSGDAPSGYQTALDTSKFLPDMEVLDFISGVINMFNLFLKIDVDNKILTFDTYDTVFMNKINPYNIDDKIDLETVEVSKIEDYDPSILFEEPENLNHLGDNYFIGSSSTNALSTSYRKTSNSFYNKTYNHVGKTEGEIEIPFAAPKVKRMYIRNTENYDATISGLTSADHVIFIPDMSEQTRYDNGGNDFNGGTDETTAYNEEDTIKFKGTPTLAYYYGVSNSSFNQIRDAGASSDYFYVDFDNTKQKIGIASPFAYKAYRSVIDDQLDDSDNGSVENMYASYLQSLYLNMGSNFSGNFRYSLIFGDSHNFADTLYTKFYQNRMKRYADSEVLSAEIRMNEIDWNTMQFNQPIIYRNEIYSLMEIKDYSIVKGSAKIKLIKHL